MGKLRIIGGLLGELGDQILDWLEDRASKETDEIQEIEVIEGEVIEPLLPAKSEEKGE